MSQPVEFDRNVNQARNDGQASGGYDGRVGRYPYFILPADGNDAFVADKDPSWNATMRTTCVATMLDGGHATNALPQRATANINCRIFPGTTTQQVHDKLAIEAPKPDLVVYLQAPANVLLDRIARRGIGYEGLIDASYLERLNDAYARYFHEYEGGPLLIVNAATIDPINNAADYDELLTAITRTNRGRMYFNPMRHQAI